MIRSGGQQQVEIKMSFGGKTEKLISWGCQNLLNMQKEWSWSVRKKILIGLHHMG